MKKISDKSKIQNIGLLGAKMKILVVIATYNERENIGSLIPNVLALRDDIEVLIIDDSSPDGTGELADELARKTGRVEVIHRPGKLGLGTALKMGMARAVERKADLMATMDADHSHAPKYLPQLIERIESAKGGIVVGSRYVPGGGVRNWGLRRRILSRTANLYARFATGITVRDCTSGYRVYGRELLEKVDIQGIGSRGYSFLVEILVLAQRGGFHIEEVPIIFVDRIRGQSKISLEEAVGGALNLLKLRFRKS